MKRIAVAVPAPALAIFAHADVAAPLKAKCAMCHGQDAIGGALHKDSRRPTGFRGVVFVREPAFGVGRPTARRSECAPPRLRLPAYRNSQR